MKQKFEITGMSCSACSAHIEKNVGKLNGVNSVNVNLLANTMLVDFNYDELDANRIMQTVLDSGYGATLQNFQSNSNEKYIYENNSNGNYELLSMERRLLVSFLFLIPIFYVSMGYMAGWPIPSIFHGNENSINFAFTQFLLLLPIVYVNRKYYKVGFRSLYKGSPNMDSLIAVGSFAAIVYSVFAIYKIGSGLGRGDDQLIMSYSMDLYFESAAMILTLITLGKYFETRSKSKTSKAISKLIELAPKTAFVIRNELKKEIPIEEVKKNDILVVKSGQSIPVDGVILEGEGLIDESYITENSTPVYKKVGDKVLAATINKSGNLKFKASNVGEDTTLSKMIALVEEANSSKAPIAKLADKVSGIFVRIVIVIALLTSIIWMILGYPIELAISMGFTVLIISCPCAVSLAAPVAIMVGTGLGAENGILIKSTEALELSHLIDTVVLDKTGIITEGRPVVTDIFLKSTIEEDYFLTIAASIERPSEHPLGQAIVKEATRRQLKLQPIESFNSSEGRGIEAKIEGKLYLAGNAQYMKDNHISLRGFIEKSNYLSVMGKTPIYFAHGDEILGMVAVADRIRSTSKEAIDRLKAMGIEVIMLTGDNQRTTEAIRKQIGIQKAISDVLPQDKENEIKKLQEQGKRVAMIGDGINDAPALALADVGIAIGAATDIAIESADIVLMKNSLLDVISVIQLSKAVIRNIKYNLFWSLFYNAMGIPLAAGVFYFTFGWIINPMITAAAMSLSAVCVVSNALCLKLSKTNFYISTNPDLVTYKIRTEECKDSVLKTESYTSNEEEDNLTKNIIIKINGMMCSHCAGRVTTALNGIEYVTAKVDLNEKIAYVELAKNIDNEMINNAITAAGYEVVSIEETDKN